ncbi:sugar phosphate isomerase/epimerase family protein [Sediminispirochaeta smaragdinae]|uniref:Xylose isomerase domain protein TIM barrel n=1 Tax=Sediminispirochaeta smaragdinae (strain DSM 11293 / JCM 15392 / SEBR 4228) TaxID=573413 RepID=E1RBW4_SEDSS|nr:sugar phosphate isomerase/epimerase family protein [Sediminispirochaeta smaragdinae]ADK79844.1 Xylose isomerase domain protein TIM barrel [Sediminispirochaeta smaragdinae DSM 11293]
MKRLITLASGQFGDLGLEELCALAQKMGYDGLELATHAHFDVQKALHDESYIPYVQQTLAKYGLACRAISAHLTGQCVCDLWDERLDNFAPSRLAGQPEAIRAWAIEEMKDTARAAQAFGVDVVNGFTGSPIWARWYSYPQTSAQMIDDGFKLVYDLWTPIFDVFDACGVTFALEVHPTEIAFDYYTTERLLELFEYRPTLGLNYDPSHLLWQGVDEVGFVRDFAQRVYHVHMKDVKMQKNDRAGILGSFLPFGDTRRAWDFVSIGHGDVDFDGIIRELNRAGYTGPLSVEWEDSGMDRETGATESCAYIKRMNFSPSSIAFDSALKNE